MRLSWLSLYQRLEVKTRDFAHALTHACDFPLPLIFTSLVLKQITISHKMTNHKKKSCCYYFKKAQFIK